MRGNGNSQNADAQNQPVAPAQNQPVAPASNQLGPSKTDKAAAAIKNARIETVFLVQKIIQLASVVLMVPLGLTRLKYLDNVPDLMVTIYLQLFSAMFVMVEFNVAGGRTKFYFLNSSLGKGIFYAFLFLFCYANARNGAIWIDVFLSVIFFILSILMILMFVIFRH